MEETLLLFLGWLAAEQAVTLGWDKEKQTYVEKHTGTPAGDLVRDFLEAVRGKEETERN